MTQTLRDALRLYVIPDREVGYPLSLADQTRLAVEGGATAIQLRDKPQRHDDALEGGELCDVAAKMLEICRSRGAIFFVNDRVDIALAIGADGVHIGQCDMPLALVKKIVPKGFIVGVSVRTESELEAAISCGADYLGFGAIFPTGSKEDAKVIGIEGLKKLASRTKVPSVAIGGINLSNINEIFAAGVDGAAVISAAVRGNMRENMKALGGYLK